MATDAIFPADPASPRGSERAFLGTAALLFAASAAVTVAWGTAMPGDMAICGGGAMSLAWMPMPGQSWLGAAASFLGMWIVMMVAMMLPSLVPMLRGYRRAVGGAGARHLGPMTVLVGVGYFAVWAAAGTALFPLGAALAAAGTALPPLAVPLAAGMVVLLAGALQLTRWKARRLACCRALPGCCSTLPADAGTALRHGLRLGVHCACCCGNLMAVLLVLGVMDLRAMAAVTAVVTAERLVPAGGRIARATGVVTVGAGVLLLARAAGLA